jgi:hypothetical protein
MKKLMVLLVTAFMLTVSAKAQVNISVNIGRQPVWGPTGYDHVDYYYMPDADIYYYVPDRVYIYRDGTTWRRTTVLPVRYNTIDLYTTHKVVINNVQKPYLNHAKYQKEYVAFKGKHDQTPIRDAKEEKYYENRQHPQHAEWRKSHPNNNKAKGKGVKKGRGH